MSLVFLLLTSPVRLFDDGVIVDGEWVRTARPVLRELGQASFIVSRAEVKPLDGMIEVQVSDDRFVQLGPGIRLIRTMVGLRLVRPKRGNIFLRGEGDDPPLALPSPIDVRLTPQGFDIADATHVPGRYLRTGITPPTGHIVTQGGNPQSQKNSSNPSNGRVLAPRASSGGESGGDNGAQTHGVLPPITIPLGEGGGVGPATVGSSPPIASPSGG